MHILEDYNSFVGKLDRLCHRIVQRHADQIACTRACAGNCCRIHLSVYPVEAVSMALDLHRLPPDLRQHIRAKARQTGSFGPCPLLQEGICLMYDARAVICRTHGLPVSSAYRGRRTVGYCVKNFKQTGPVPDEDIIDLERLNRSLAGINVRFVHRSPDRLPGRRRLTIAEAMLIPDSSIMELMASPGGFKPEAELDQASSRGTTCELKKN